MVVCSCPAVVDLNIVRPDLKYQLGFSVQDGVVIWMYKLDLPLFRLSTFSLWEDFHLRPRMALYMYSVLFVLISVLVCKDGVDTSLSHKCRLTFTFCASSTKQVIAHSFFCSVSCIDMLPATGFHSRAQWYSCRASDNRDQWHKYCWVRARWHCVLAINDCGRCKLLGGWSTADALHVKLKLNPFLPTCVSSDEMSIWDGLRLPLYT